MHYPSNGSHPSPRLKPWLCACCDINLLQSQVITSTPPHLHALLEVYPASFRQLWTMVEPCAFMLGRSRDTNSNLHGRAPRGLLTLQCSCHFFSGWFGLLLQMFRGSETNLSLITVTCWLLFGFQSKGGCDIIIMINEQTKYTRTQKKKLHQTKTSGTLQDYDFKFIGVVWALTVVFCGSIP